MAITARAAADKISELRSKLAVYATWTETIKVNYMPSDGGAPEVRIHREDGGAVTEDHLIAVLDDIETKCDELRAELAEWESLVFEPSAAVVHSLDEHAERKKRTHVDRKPRRPIEAAAKEP